MANVDVFQSRTPAERSSGIEAYPGNSTMCRLRRSPRRVAPWIEGLLRGCAVACAALFVLGGTLRAESPWPLVLFDGKSLDGWKKTDFANAGEVKVEDGSIV